MPCKLIKNIVFLHTTSYRLALDLDFQIFIEYNYEYDQFSRAFFFILLFMY